MCPRDGALAGEWVTCSRQAQRPLACSARLEPNKPRRRPRTLGHGRGVRAGMAFRPLTAPPPRPHPSHAREPLCTRRPASRSRPDATGGLGRALGGGAAGPGRVARGRSGRARGVAPPPRPAPLSAPSRRPHPSRAREPLCTRRPAARARPDATGGLGRALGGGCGPRARRSGAVAACARGFAALSPALSLAPTPPPPPHTRSSQFARHAEQPGQSRRGLHHSLHPAPPRPAPCDPPTPRPSPPRLLRLCPRP